MGKFLLSIALVVLQFATTLAEDKPSSSVFSFDGQLKHYFYLPVSEEFKDQETVFLWTTKGDVYRGNNYEWQKIDSLKDVQSVYHSDTEDNQVYVYTHDTSTSNVVAISWDRGNKFEDVKMPGFPGSFLLPSAKAVQFHPKHKDWILFTGTEKCNQLMCPSHSYLSQDKGKTWKKILDNSSDCSWVTHMIEDTDENSIFCLQRIEPTNEGNKHKYVFSSDYFATAATEVPELNELITAKAVDKFVIAIKYEPKTPESKDDDDRATRVYISNNGKQFGPAKYPTHVDVDPSAGVTALTTNQDYLQLYESASGDADEEFGYVLRSDVYGTEFTVVMEHVNKAHGYVDFEEMSSVEGVALTNVVDNPQEVLKGQEKKLQTYISYSGGSEWSHISVPNLGKDSVLHLHGFTDRLDRRNHPSSPYAVGMFIGRGNVANVKSKDNYLKPIRESQTYMTRDGGITWNKISDHPMYWVYGDSGSFIVLVDSLESTKTFMYSFDQGKTWAEQDLAKEIDYPLKVVNLVSVPSGTSTKVMLMGTPPIAKGNILQSVVLDFTKALGGLCSSSDFEDWSPYNPVAKTSCILGKEVIYERRKQDKTCLIGREYKLDDGTTLPIRPPSKTKTCKCTRLDYECEPDFSNGKDGVCKLIEGAKFPDSSDQCANGRTTWYKITGYRKLVNDACEGGETLNDPTPHECTEADKKPADPKKPAPPPPQPPQPEPTQPVTPPVDDHPGRPGDEKKSSHKFRNFVVLVILSILGVALFGIVRTFAPNIRSVQLPENARNMNFNVDFDGVKSSAGSFFHTVFGMFTNKLRLPTDHMGFYSRMNDDERYRVLESDFSDIDEDNEIMDEPGFQDEEQDPISSAFNDQESQRDSQSPHEFQDSEDPHDPQNPQNSQNP